MSRVARDMASAGLPPREETMEPRMAVVPGARSQTVPLFPLVSK